MTTRVLAVMFGIIAGIGTAAGFYFDWGEIVALLPIGPPDTVAALSIRGNRLACAIAGTATAFATVALLTAVAGGIIETGKARRKIAALRDDTANVPTELDTILAGTAVAAAGAADAMPALLALEHSWLERLTLRQLTAPLPALVLAADGVLALFGDISGTGWDIALAAGLCGWLAIGLARYLAAIVVGPLVGATFEMLRLAQMLRPALISSPAIPAPGASFDAGAVARDLADLLAEPLERLADAADRLGSVEAAPFREQSVDAALAEIRQGIERLLAASGSR